MAIKDVQEGDRKLFVKDESGNYVGIFQHLGEFIGYSDSFIAVRRTVNIHLLNEKGLSLKSFPFKGTPQKVVGDTIICVDGDKEIVYDKNGVEV